MSVNPAGAEGPPPPTAPPRQVLALAVPAFVVLAAEPLYLLVDTAVIGHLGSTQLAALAVGGVVFAQVAGQFNFLAYGTTGRSARRFGAGDRAAAVAEGVQASWLAVGFGLAIVVLIELLAGPIVRLLAGGGTAVAAGAETWLRIAVLGAPGILLSLAGNGWMRGIQDTRRPTRYVLLANGLSLVLCPILVYPAGLGLAGSAVANVVAQTVGGGLFLAALLRERPGIRPRKAIIVAQLRLGRDLMLRTLLLQACFIIAAAVAARMGTSHVAAHQIALQLWMFLALALDSLAIAAQALVGQSLGAGDGEVARLTAWRVGLYGLVAGTVAGGLMLAGISVIPGFFTSDPAVLEQAHTVWLWFALMQPAAGVVFALDGVLMGAGDVGYLRTITLLASLVGFLPLTLLALPLGWGLTGIWAGLTLFIVLRLVALVARVRSGRWLVFGVH